ncbi:phospholipase D-like domain-containing protein [Paracoccus contaminans]|uniref:Phospholipase D n=1 Tax=Paracoccus contaminans TaxID=1945662 RepID=A0A1W6CXI3_9RHOB|nr:phospholipase D family protein [Paracoccus contaminans]ARJ69587.1 hypothetical protein B0A89_08075 [Paracoccus contaminans]
MVLVGLIATVVAALLILALLHLYYRPPSLKGRTVSAALPPSPQTRIGHAALTAGAGHPGTSGVVALSDGLDAFAARVALIQAAERSLDLQYYIWQHDLTGLFLLNEVRKAAERGVRVRMLLDDNGIPSSLDADLAALNSMPTVEVRLFNPFILRWPKTAGYLFDFVRLNRRMHNKLMIADGAATILGGRNIGDIYFSYGAGPHYLDTDVLAVGEVAAEAGADFDRYWASRSAYPAERILTRGRAAPRGRADLRTALAEEKAQSYRQAVQTRPLVADLIAGHLALDWVPVHLVSDDPAKGLGLARSRDLLFAQLMRLIASPRKSVDIASAYFVPGKSFTQRLVRLVNEGVRVRILTNSQEATDVLVVHSAYVKYRPALLEGGVRLYELRATPAQPRERARGTSTRASLHSKTVSVDEERVFIGSFNFDPRSVVLNTEMGVMIDSPRLARELTAGFDEVLPQLSYVPKRDEYGLIQWHEPGNPAGTAHLAEPGTNRVQRLMLWLLGRLPIEWLL